ncbi:hypothetical protein GW17_00044815 [Ensete ventricosum]|nr:hypothetical protein GW17_00044815 [Ensete ventricosum]
MNFNMSKFEVTLPKLLNMLREADIAIKKEKPILYIGETKKKRKASKTIKKGKGKERLGKAKVVKKYLTKDSASNTTKMGIRRGTRSIAWILLERKTLDFLHPLHPDMEYIPIYDLPR